MESHICMQQEMYEHNLAKPEKLDLRSPARKAYPYILGFIKIFCSDSGGNGNHKVLS